MENVNQNDLWGILQGVHSWAHLHFQYVPDEDRWTKDFAWNNDHWETREELYNDIKVNGYVSGDCDAFAMLCWMELRRIGMNSRLVVCLAENGGGHLVCECQGWILDNRYKVVVSNVELEKTGYKWLSISGYNPGEQWYQIKGTTL